MGQENKEQAAMPSATQNAQLESYGSSEGQQAQVLETQVTGVKGATTTVTTTAIATTTSSSVAEVNDKDRANSSSQAKTTQGSNLNSCEIKTEPILPKKVLAIGFDPNQYPDFLDLEKEAALHLQPEHQSSIDLCAPFVFIGAKDELEGDENFLDYDDYKDVEDDEDDDDEDDDVEDYFDVFDDASNQKYDFNVEFLREYDRKQAVPWVYPGAKWVNGIDNKKKFSIRATAFQIYEKKTHTLTKITNQLENYYSEIRIGNRLKAYEKRIMLALLEERNRIFMPSGYMASAKKLNVKNLSLKEQDALDIFKRRLKSLVYFAEDREITCNADIGDNALLWFNIKDANKLNQLRSLNGSGILFVQEDKHPFKNYEGYTWYVNARPNSFYELIDNLKRFHGLR